jgi:small subunit ribosomal protein S13e
MCIIQMKGEGKGISSSALPYKRKAPKWVTLSSSAISDIII